MVPVIEHSRSTVLVGTYSGAVSSIRHSSLTGNSIATAKAPLCDSPCVHMDEIRTRIITDTSSVERQGGSSQFQCVRSWQPDIDGFCLHVNAVLCDSCRMSPQVFIAPPRTIPANDFDFRDAELDSRQA